MTQDPDGGTGTGPANRQVPEPGEYLVCGLFLWFAAA